MNPIIKFFHELLNPHCAHCMEHALMQKEEERVLLERSFEDKRCRACESLERQLAVANEQINKLTEKIVNPNPQPISTSNEQAPKVLHRGPVPFDRIRRQLEAESRAIAAKAMENAAKPDSELVGNNASVSELEQSVLNATVSRTAQTDTKQ